MSIGKNPLIELLILFIFLSVAVGISYVAKVFIVDGDSMFPTLKTDERIVVDKRAYIYVKPVKNDIVGMSDPTDQKLLYVKRIVATPGDIVEVNQSEVIVNDRILYNANQLMPLKEIKIPSGYYFVMGDNKGVSYDSRQFGLVPESNIIGRAVMVVWPVSNFRVLN